MAKIISIALAVQTFVAFSQASCYFPNGTDRNVDFATPQYSPCPSTGSLGMCCAEWDTCLDSGLCQSTLNDAIWRESCSTLLRFLIDLDR